MAGSKAIKPHNAIESNKKLLLRHYIYYIMREMLSS